MENGLSYQLDDQVIRNAIKEQLRKRNTPLIVDEFELSSGQSRVDLFVFDKVFTGIEIKSERDTLVRLPKQVSIYNKYFEKIEIIVGIKHLEKVLAVVPKWWGVATVEYSNKKIIFKQQRKSRLNPLFLSESLLEFLWKEEVVELLNLYGFNKGIKSQCRHDLRSSAKNYISHEELRYFVLDFMKKRMNWRSDVLQKPSDD